MGFLKEGINLKCQKAQNKSGRYKIVSDLTGKVEF